MLALMLALVGAAFWLRRSRPSIAAVLAVCGLHQVAALAFYAGIFHYRQAWYLLSPGATLCLGLALALGALWPAQATGRAPLAAAALIGLLVVTQAPRAMRIERGGVYPWQIAYMEVGEGIIPTLGPQARVASFNAGMFGFFATEQGVGRQVVNLDGVVNGEVLAAMRQRRLLAYLRQRGITHVIDHERAIREAVEGAKPAFATAFDLVAQRSVACSGGPILILRLKAAPLEDEHR